MKKYIAVLLALLMCGGVLTGCRSRGETGRNDAELSGAVPSYTYNSAVNALGSSWNPHTWETNADNTILSYISTPFCAMSVLDSENGVYQWVYEMADSITDVTKEHKDDLIRYHVTLQEGRTADNTESGYVFEIKLNPDAKWQDGTPINADSYIYSMQQLLNPRMKNYRANLYVAGESALAGAESYYYAGSAVWLDTAGAYPIDSLTKADDGSYTTAEGMPIRIAVKSALSHLGGSSLEDYVNTYGEAYFGQDGYSSLAALCDSEGNVTLTDETLAYLTDCITANAEWGETEADARHYLLYGMTYPEADYDTVGCYKADDYTIRYVTQNYIDINYFLTSCTSTWLVYEPLYEAGKDSSGELVTTDYGTSAGTTMSCGPYRIASLQADRQIVFVQNENWFGWEKDENGSLVSYTNFEVDGERRQQYRTTRIVIDVMEESAMKQAFLKGEISEWSPSADELTAYASSEQLYKVDETYTMSFFFNTDIDALRTMDTSRGNTNSVVLSNKNFRKAFSRAVNRAEFVTATPGYKPTFALMNNLYFYDIYNDPSSSYRGSDEAKLAVTNLYGVEFGAGKAYATLNEAHDSVTGYNLTEARNLMKTACGELVADGLYTAGSDIVIRIGWSKAALQTSDNNQIALMNKYINAAAEGSGFGKITLEGVGSIEDRYGAVPAGEYAVGYGAWGGAAFYPFRNLQVYCDTDQYEINEAACWDPAAEMLTLTVNGEKVTMSWKEWSGALIGSGRFTEADNKTKLAVTAQLEQLYLEKYYRIPLCSTTTCSILSYKNSYYTKDYNIMYGFGGLRLMNYHYSDAEWSAFLAEQGGTLKYE